MQANAIVEAAQGDSDVIPLDNVFDPAMTYMFLPKKAQLEKNLANPFTVFCKPFSHTSIVLFR